MSLQSIGTSAFYGCEMLSQVMSESYHNLQRVGEWAFGKTLLKPKEVFFPDKLYVPRNAFKKNRELE